MIIKSKYRYYLLRALRLITNDSNFYKIRYYLKFKKKLDFINPTTFNEKLHWLKLYDRNPFYSELVDKYKVRKYVSDKIGEEYLIPCIGVYYSIDEIDISSLPSEFVLKAVHGSGWVTICRDKKNFNFSKEKKKLNYWLSNNFYNLWAEWPYKNLKAGIICEKFISGKDKTVPLDYKFYCFNGVPKYVHIDYGRFNNHRRNFYDMNWTLLPISLCYPNDTKINHKKPEKFELMKRLVSKLSEGLKFARIDLYDVENHIYFGEITFYPGNGLEIFDPEEYDIIFGKDIHI